MSANKTIFVISSNYLEAVHKESGKYSFELIGCGKFETACRVIQNVSVGTLLGVSIVEQRLPDIKSREGKALLQFLNILGDMQQNIRLNVIVTREALGTGYSKAIKKHKNIQGFCHDNAEAVTDSLINGEVFGSLLLEDAEIYALNKPKEKTFANTALKTININNYFSEYLLKVLNPCIYYATFEQTCLYDSACQEYKEMEDVLLLNMRRWYVGMMCNFDVAGYQEEVYGMLISDVQSETFPERYILYEYLYRNVGGKQ